MTDKTPPRVESIPELRRIVQEPVAHRNDLTGKLYGSRISIFITQFFLKRGWSANCASGMMLLNGLAGSALLTVPGWWQVLGFFLLESYYIFDCVDGELARYHRISNLKAAYYDYIAHVLVKPLMFVCLGIGLSRQIGAQWPLWVAMAPALAVLWSKIASDLHYQIFCSKFMLYRDLPAIENFYRARSRGPNPSLNGAAKSAESPAEATAPPASEDRSFSIGMLREILLNFDLYLILFMIAAALDMFVTIPGLPYWLGFKMAMLLFYAVALPLNFLDHFFADMTSKRMLDRVDQLNTRLDEMTGNDDAGR